MTYRRNIGLHRSIKAKKIIEAHEKGLEKANEDLDKKEIRRDEGAEKSALAIGFGKTIEKLIHLHN